MHQLIVNNQSFSTMSIYILYHRGTLGQQSWHDVQALHASEDMGVRLNDSTGGRITDPSPSCSVPRGVLHTTASLAVSHWTEKAAARGPPEARLMRSGTSTSLVSAGPVHSITQVLHRVVTVGRLTGRSLPPCDEPSTQGSRLRSTDVLQKPWVSQLYSMLR